MSVGVTEQDTSSHLSSLGFLLQIGMGQEKKDTFTASVAG